MKSVGTARAKAPEITEEMKAWSAALGAEIAGWPHASARVFFGFTALYRGDIMFAPLPRTRSLGLPNSLIFKLRLKKINPTKPQSKLNSASALFLERLEKDR